MDPRKRHNPTFKGDKFSDQSNRHRINARKSREYPASLNNISKNNNPV